MRNDKKPLPTEPVVWEYAITVKWNRKRVPVSQHFEEWITFARQREFCVNEFWYEYDKAGRLHMHGIAKAQPNYFKKRLDKAGYHRHITRICGKKDRDDWLRYCKKDQPQHRAEMERDAQLEMERAANYASGVITADDWAAIEEYELEQLTLYPDD